MFQMAADRTSEAAFRLSALCQRKVPDENRCLMKNNSTLRTDPDSSPHGFRLYRKNQYAFHTFRLKKLCIICVIPVRALPAPEGVEMEIAAFVLFGSVALWFAEELHDRNQ